MAGGKGAAVALPRRVAKLAAVAVAIFLAPAVTAQPGRPTDPRTIRSIAQDAASIRQDIADFRANATAEIAAAAVSAGPVRCHWCFRRHESYCELQ